MSTFRIPVVAVRGIEPIPDADRIELAVVGDFRTVVLKDSVSSGDLVAYMPEGTLVPEWLLRRLGLWDGSLGKGVLSGEAGNRISVRHMKRTLTEGIVVPLETEGGAAVLVLADGSRVPVVPDQDVAALLGATKWRPPVPPDMDGRLTDIHGHTQRYEIESRKAWPDVLREGEPVSYTEKLHGVFDVVGIVPGLDHPDLLDGDTFTASKLVYGNGLVFSDVPENASNIYVRMMHLLKPQIARMRGAAGGLPVHVAGELFGLGVQRRFGYGQGRHAFRAFDVYLGPAKRGRWLDVEDKKRFLDDAGFERVHTLYEGPHSVEAMCRHRSGESVTGGGVHIREGIVITPMTERDDPGLGRVILKEVSPAYLKKTDGTELS